MTPHGLESVATAPGPLTGEVSASAPVPITVETTPFERSRILWLLLSAMYTEPVASTTQLVGPPSVALSAAPSAAPETPVPTTVVVMPAVGVSMTERKRLFVKSATYATLPAGVTQRPVG